MENQAAQAPNREPVVNPTILSTQPELKNNSALIILSILVLVLFGVVVFLGYQNYKFQNKITKLTSLPTPSPAQAATTDPTADWKTYINSEFGISFKLPQTWSQFTTSGGEYFATDSDTKINIRLSKGVVTNSDAYSLAFSKTVGQSVVSTQYTKLEDKTVDGRPAILMSMDYLQNIQEVPSFSYVYVIKDGTSLYTLNFWQDETQGQDIKTNILNNESTFNQILSTFNFLNNTATNIQKPISDLFDSINKEFGTNLMPTTEDQFYSPTGPIIKKSWKLDLLNNPKVDGKEFSIFLSKNLNPNYDESGGIGGGGIDAYQNNSIKCFHSYMSQGPDIHNYFSCALK